jgi:hypothetical protein
MHWSAPADNGSQSHYSRAVGVVGAHRVGTLRSVAVLSREEFDAIEFDAAFSGEHRSAAQRMTTLARTGTQTEAMPRAEAFLRAGEQWLLADDPAAAASRFRMAMADGGSASVDPRVPLARALFQLGEADEARALIATLKGEGRTDPRACDLVAELLVEYSDPQGALEWATAGVELCLRYAEREGAPAPGREPSPDRRLASVPAHRQRSDDETELRLLLSLRYRIRNDLGLPEDSYDEMLDET